jgi:hypothetical protein
MAQLGPLAGAATDERVAHDEWLDEVCRQYADTRLVDLSTTLTGKRLLACEKKRGDGSMHSAQVSTAEQRS